MTATIRACPIKINAPKVYGYRDFMPNDVNAEVVLLEKVCRTASTPCHPYILTDATTN
jgi:hypothetical protein